MPIGALVAVPELQNEGLAKLIAERSGFLTIKFLGTGAEMIQETVQVVRWCLLPGTRIGVDLAGVRKPGKVTDKRLARDQATGLLVYTVAWDEGGEAAVREDGIVAVPAPSSAEEQLLTIAFNDIRALPGARATGAARMEAWGPLTFSAREELLAWRDSAWQRCGGVVGLAGARVIPLSHQLLAARTALLDRQVRFLLADEVGLGKTIEAGLIVQSLLAMKPDLRVLVVAPGALLGQWFLELYVRFGGRKFTMFDAERLATWEGNPWSDQQFVLASSRGVEDLDGKAAMQFATAKWDVLIVDECHRMQPSGVLYKRLAVLSKSAPHVLLLSATPARSHPDAYLALLHLLQPTTHRLDDKVGFAQRIAAHDQVVDLVRATERADADVAALAPRWSTVLAGDPVATRLIANLPKGGPACAELVAHVREHHWLDRRILRRTRRQLARFEHGNAPRVALATRRSERVAYTPDEHEQKARAALDTYASTLLAAHAPAGDIPPRLAHWLLTLQLASASHPQVLTKLLAMRNAVLEAPGDFASYRAKARAGEATAHVLRPDLSEGEVATHLAVSAACHVDPKIETDVLEALRNAAEGWAAQAARKPTPRLKALCDRIATFWKDHPREKILVFTAHGLSIRPLVEAFESRFGEDTVASFGSHQDPAQREEAARRFHKEDACSILVSDPLGGEGRNFQFASVVAHHDLPWSVAAVEQRIGRVDRLGRDGEVPSWVVVPKDEGCIDSAWCELLETAEVFNRPASGLEFALDPVESKALLAVLARGGQGIAGANGLRAALPELNRLLADERAAAEKRDDEAGDADAAGFTEAARLAAAVGDGHAPVEAVTRWVRGLGGGTKREEEYPHAVRLRPRRNDQPERGVFAREAALANPDVSFFSIGHGLIDQLVDDAARADWCRANAWRRKPGIGCAKWEGLRVVLDLVPDFTAIAAAGLRIEVLRRLYVAAPPRRLTVFVRSDGTVEDEALVVQHLSQPFDIRKGDAAISQTGDREAWTRPIIAGQPEKITAWQAEIGRAIAAAKVHAEAILPNERSSVGAALAAHLDPALAAARASAAGTAARLGGDHSDTIRAKLECEDELKQHGALTAAVTNARLEIASLAYLVVT